MRRITGLKLAASVFAAGAAFVSHGASAREITDWEASKLTLDALTATPVYHRPAASSVRHHSAAVHQVASRHEVTATSRRALVHTVVYHAKAPVSSKHHLRRHG